MAGTWEREVAAGWEVSHGPGYVAESRSSPQPAYDSHTARALLTCPPAHISALATNCVIESFASYAFEPESNMNIRELSSGLKAWLLANCLTEPGVRAADITVDDDCTLGRRH